jgi:hypothetical protein
LAGAGIPDNTQGGFVRKIYITFSGQRYDDTTTLIVRDAQRYGASEAPWVYDDKWLMGTDFYRHNHWLWEHPGDRNGKRGFGWYAWKPYIIMDALERLEDGDIVLYTDADTYPIADFSVLYDECNRIGGAMLFSAVGWEHCQQIWCKRDCFIVMGQDEPKYHNADAGVSRFMLFQKGPWKPRQFLMEWLTYCVNPLATTFDENVLGKPNLLCPSPATGQPDRPWPGPNFIEHLTEQSIMTNLAHKYGYKLYRELCQFGEISSADRDLYPQLFRQQHMHRYAQTTAGSRFRNMYGMITL